MLALFFMNKYLLGVLGTVAVAGSVGYYSAQKNKEVGKLKEQIAALQKKDEITLKASEIDDKDRQDKFFNGVLSPKKDGPQEKETPIAEEESKQPEDDKTGWLVVEKKEEDPRIAQLQAKINDLNKQLAQKNQNKEADKTSNNEVALRQQIDDLKRQMQQLQRNNFRSMSLGGRSPQVKNLENANVKLAQKIKDLKQQLDFEREAHDRLLLEKDELVARNDDLNNHFDEFKNQEALWNVQNEILQEQQQALNDEKKRLEEQNARLNEQLQGAKAERDNAKAERDLLQGQIDGAKNQDRPANPNNNRWDINFIGKNTDPNITKKQFKQLKENLTSLDKFLKDPLSVFPEQKEEKQDNDQELLPPPPPPPMNGKQGKQGYDKEKYESMLANVYGDGKPFQKVDKNGDPDGGEIINSLEAWNELQSNIAKNIADKEKDQKAHWENSNVTRISNSINKFVEGALETIANKQVKNVFFIEGADNNKTYFKLDLTKIKDSFDLATFSNNLEGWRKAGRLDQTLVDKTAKLVKDINDNKETIKNEVAKNALYLKQLESLNRNEGQLKNLFDGTESLVMQYKELGGNLRNISFDALNEFNTDYKAKLKKEQKQLKDEVKALEKKVAKENKDIEEFNSAFLNDLETTLKSLWEDEFDNNKALGTTNVVVKLLASSGRVNSGLLTPYQEKAKAMQPIYNKLQEEGGFESIKRAFGIIEAKIEAKGNMTAEENQVLKIVKELEKTDNVLYEAFKEKIKGGNPFTEESFVKGLSTKEDKVDKEREALVVHIAASKMKHKGDDLEKISKIVDDTIKFTTITTSANALALNKKKKRQKEIASLLKLEQIDPQTFLTYKGFLIRLPRFETLLLNCQPIQSKGWKNLEVLGENQENIKKALPFLDNIAESKQDKERMNELFGFLKKEEILPTVGPKLTTDLRDIAIEILNRKEDYKREDKEIKALAEKFGIIEERIGFFVNDINKSRKNYKIFMETLFDVDPNESKKGSVLDVLYNRFNNVIRPDKALFKSKKQAAEVKKQ